MISAATEVTSFTRLAAAAAEAWRPRPDMPRSQWCAEHLWLPVESSASPGRYDLDRYPFWREVLDAADDPEVEQIVLVGGAQLGKTLMLQALLASTSILAPAPAMLATPDQDSLIELRDRFYALCESSPALEDLIPEPRLRNDRWIDVGPMRIHAAWSMATQRLSGKACQLVCCTELDRWRQSTTHGDPLRLAEQRTKAFWRSLLVAESTPTGPAGRIWRLYRQSDQRRYCVPCPKCGHYQELRFFPHPKGPYAGRGGVMGLRDDRGNWRRADQVRDAAWYMCEQGCRIDDAQKSGMVASGRWVPRGQTVDKRGALVGKARRGPRIWGGQLTSLVSDTVSFGKLAAAYLDARHNLQDLRSFWNDWLGLPFRKKVKQPRWQTMGQRLSGGHALGTVPAAAWFLTAGVDVQEALVYYAVRAWGVGGTSWLVDWGVFRRQVDVEGRFRPNSDLEQLTAGIVERAWPVDGKTMLGAQSLPCRMVSIDTGYRIHDVHEWVRKHPGDRVRAVAGSDQVRGMFEANVIEHSTRTGRAYVGGLKQWRLNVSAYKEDLRTRQFAPTDQPGAWLLPADAVRLLPAYLKQLCNEVPVDAPNKRGQVKRIWTVISHALGNHALDCETYARAGADFVCGGRWDEATLRSLLAEARPPPPSTPRVRMPDGRPFLVTER